MYASTFAQIYAQGDDKYSQGAFIKVIFLSPNNLLSFSLKAGVEFVLMKPHE